MSQCVECGSIMLRSGEFCSDQCMAKTKVRKASGIERDLAREVAKERGIFGRCPQCEEIFRFSAPHSMDENGVRYCSTECSEACRLKQDVKGVNIKLTGFGAEPQGVSFNLVAFPDATQMKAWPRTVYRKLDSNDKDSVVIVADDGHQIRWLELPGEVISLALRRMRPGSVLSDNDMETALRNFEGVRVYEKTEDYVDDEEEDIETETVYVDRLQLPSAEALGIALHVCDPDVLEYACKVGEASKEPDGKKLLERGPNVIEAIEKMWDRDELGLKSKWLDMAERALAVLRPKK